MSNINSISPQMHNALIDISKRIVFFFGAGISASLAEKNYSWEQWVRDGITLLPDAEQRNDFYKKLEDTPEKQGKSSAKTLISVLNELQNELHRLPGLYEKWMHNAFEYLDVNNHALADTLKKLLVFHDIFVTTNYDNLLEQATGLKGASYLHPEIVYPMLDEKRNDHIIHIHGRYSTNPNDPEDSIIATKAQYEAILENQGAQFIQNVIGTSTIIFIGCGQTTSDQNISRFITFSKRYLNLNNPFYFLYKNDEPPGILPDNVQPVCYGNEYCELPIFLKAMAEIRMDAFVHRYGFIELFPASVTAELRSAFSQYYFAAEEISFYGRTDELAVIDDFMAQAEACLWYAMSGQAGSGKSRLALEICHRYSSRWCAFFLQPYGDAALLDEFVPYRNTLIVIDDFKGQEKNVALLIEKIFTLFIKTNYKVRILLCERESDIVFGTWFNDLERSFENGYLPEFRNRRYGGKKQNFLVLGDLNDEEIENMIGEICEKNRLPADSKRNRQLRQSYGEKLEQLHYRPLFLQIFVESWINNGCSATRFDSFTELLEDILKREQERWLKELGGSYELFDAWIDLLRLAIVAGRLTKADTPEKYLSSFNSILSYINTHSFPGKQRQEKYISLIADMCHNIGQGDAYIEPMYPDLIKEYCFLYYTDMSRIIEVSHDLWNFAPKKFSKYLIRIAEDFPYHNIVFAAMDGNPADRFRQEALEARVHLLNCSTLQPGDDLEQRCAWLKREYDFWHHLAEGNDGSDEKKALLIFQGLNTVARQYGAHDAPWARTIETMLNIYDEALALKGGEALEAVKILTTQRMAHQLSIAGQPSAAEKLQDKVNTMMETDLGKILAESVRLEQFNTNMMDHLLRKDFMGGYETLKDALIHAKKLNSAEMLAYFLGMCHRFGYLAAHFRKERFIARSESLADQTEGMYADDKEVACTRLLIRMNRIQYDIFMQDLTGKKEELLKIFESVSEKSGSTANKCLSTSVILLLNFTDDTKEISWLQKTIRDRLESVKAEENGEDLAQAYLKCMQALKYTESKTLFTKNEIDDAWAIMLRYYESESLREIFMEMLKNSVEAKNRAHYLRHEVLTAAFSDIRYNRINPSGLDEFDIQNVIYDIQTYQRSNKKIGANETCPCGSGKKFKKCCRGNGKYD
ncbi:MAG: SIR2 family protein [Desulfovibrionaceae bacterium]|nr:SIR2 family protein [Desulfovibrionaceae bacterium]